MIHVVPTFEEANDRLPSLLSEKFVSLKKVIFQLNYLRGKRTVFICFYNASVSMIFVLHRMVSFLYSGLSPGRFS